MGDARCVMMKERAGDLTRVMQSNSCGITSEGGVKCWGGLRAVQSVAGMESGIASIVMGQARREHLECIVFFLIIEQRRRLLLSSLP